MYPWHGIIEVGKHVPYELIHGGHNVFVNLVVNAAYTVDGPLEDILLELVNPSQNLFFKA